MYKGHKKLSRIFTLPVEIKYGIAKKAIAFLLPIFPGICPEKIMGGQNEK